MEFKGNKKPDTYQVFKSNSIKQCSQIWIQLQLASTFSLFFSAALEFFLGFSQQLQKCAKIQMFSTPCRSVTSLRLSFFKILMTLIEIRDKWYKSLMYCHQYFLVLSMIWFSYTNNLYIKVMGYPWEIHWNHHHQI